LALRSATYGYCPIDVPPDIVNKDWCSDFGEGIDKYIEYLFAFGDESSRRAAQPEEDE
jgi:hypothetical protein